MRFSFQVALLCHLCPGHLFGGHVKKKEVFFCSARADTYKCFRDNSGGGRFIVDAPRLEPHQSGKLFSSSPQRLTAVHAQINARATRTQKSNAEIRQNFTGSECMYSRSGNSKWESSILSDFTSFCQQVFFYLPARKFGKSLTRGGNSTWTNFRH